MRVRKPCLFVRFLLLGWNVRFMDFVSYKYVVKIFSRQQYPHPASRFKSVTARIPAGWQVRFAERHRKYDKYF